MRYSRTSFITLLLLFTIAGFLRAQVRVIAPNGGEKYEMAQPVTVLWTSQDVEALRLEYSSDGGNSWMMVAAGIPAGPGSYTFTPFELPTKRGLVRLTAVDNPVLSDRSDRFFEIMEAPSIIIYSPVSGDNLTRGSQAVITWDANRISAVDLLFSSDGGATWTVLASNIQAPQWYYLWNVPNIKTVRGLIRVRQVGGPEIGESGLFTIGAEPQRMVRVVQPNGGEKYQEDDTVYIRWAFQGVTSVSLSFSSDGGATWTPIRANIPVGTLQYPWKITSPPGNRYRIRVDGGNGLADTSDANFEVLRRKRPRVVVESPNGGETLYVGEHAGLRWNTTDLAGQIAVEYSADSGRTWRQITTTGVPGDGVATFDWIVPDTPTKGALVRVVSVDAADTSDATFVIAVRDLTPIQVLTPNGGEVWLMGQKNLITWNAPAAVTSVDIDFSTDGGANWQRVDVNVPSASGNMQYLWFVPTLGLETQAARIRVKNSALPAQRDISDRSFTIRRGPKVAGAPADNAGGNLLLGSYPNPASGTVEIRWTQSSSSAAEIALYQADGTRIALFNAGPRGNGEQHYGLDLSGVPAGFYLYEVRAGGATLRGRLAVVH